MIRKIINALKKLFKIKGQKSEAIEIYCFSCQTESTLKIPVARCPRCHSFCVSMTGGFMRMVDRRSTLIVQCKECRQIFLAPLLGVCPNCNSRQVAANKIKLEKSEKK